MKSNDRFLVPGLSKGLVEMPALWDPLSACRIVLICPTHCKLSSSDRPCTTSLIDAGKRILQFNDRFLIPRLNRGLAGMPALGDPLSTCRIVLVCRAQIVYYWSSQRSSRTSFTVTVIDAGKRILKSIDQFLVPGLPRGLAGIPALSACQIVLIYRLQIVFIGRFSVRQSGPHSLLRYRRLQANLAVQRSVSRSEKGCLEVWRGCLHSGIHSRHVGSC